MPFSPTVNKKIDYWGRMHAVLALESFAECKGDPLSVLRWLGTEEHKKLAAEIIKEKAEF